MTQLCAFFPNLSGTVANKIEKSFYSVYSYSGIESIEHALREVEIIIIRKKLNLLACLLFPRL